ncbi:hypothetical protein [Streptomyces canus]|uniref:effector-associated constant component EACC1 n=1 Tax=Streptomyces canus TaxID=58343 RepID=UPI003243E2B5
MEVEVRVPADDGGVTLTDLYRWFRQDAELRRYAEVRLRPPRQTGGAMGAAEVIEVIGQGIALASFAVSYATWRQGRANARQVQVVIIVDGESVTLTDGSEESVRRIVELRSSSSGSDLGPDGDNTGSDGDDARNDDSGND